VNTFRKRARVALLFGCFLVGCATRTDTRPAQLHSAPASPTFVFRNMSRDRIAIYLVEDTRESLLGRLDPLQSARLPLPDRVFIGRGEMIRLAIMANGSTSLQPSREVGAIISMRHRGSSLVGQSWAFQAGQLSEP